MIDPSAVGFISALTSLFFRSCLPAMTTTEVKLFGRWYVRLSRGMRPRGSARGGRGARAASAVSAAPAAGAPQTGGGRRGRAAVPTACWGSASPRTLRGLRLLTRRMVYFSSTSLWPNGLTGLSRYCSLGLGNSSFVASIEPFQVELALLVRLAVLTGSFPVHVDARQVRPNEHGSSPDAC